MRRLLMIGIASLLCAACAAADRAESPARAPTRVDVVLFPLSAAAAIYVALDEGFYAREGLDVRLTATPSSSHLVQGLADGSYHLAAALIDNFVAYQENQHAVRHRAGRDLRVLMGLSTASVALIARNDIASIKALAGQRVGVDAPGTGFAFVLYHFTGQAGLGREDYRLVNSGSTKARWEALARGEIDATVLTPEFATQALSQGFRSLADSRSSLPAYMGAAVAAESSWARNNAKTVEAFVRASLAARAWLARPENLGTAANALSRRLGGTSDQMKTLLGSLLQNGELIPDGSIDPNAFKTVLDLRRQYGTPHRAVAAPESYLDLSYLDRAQSDAEASR